LVCVVVLACGFRADAVTFTLFTPDGRVTASVTPAERAGIAYLPLTPLLTQLGGSASVADGRCQIELRGQTAWLTVNGRDVEATASRFTMRHPLVQDAETLHVSVSDVVQLFRRALRAELDMALDADLAAPAPAGELRELVPDLPSLAEQEPDILLPASATGPVARTLRTVIVDPGHGGSDKGWVSPSGLEEKAVTLDIAQRLQTELESKLGLKVLLTRSEDMDMPVRARSRFHSLYEGDLVVSLHLGASYAEGARGVEVFVHNASGNEASRSLADQVARAVSASSSLENRGVRQAPVRVLDGGAVPGILVEAGFMTYPGDETRMATAEYRGQVAAGIAEGIRAWSAGETP
jgi:N-acetylmuramoyl-L-alanine amidase